MFSIKHDKNFVYSVITVSELTEPITKGNTLEKLMYIWANGTAIPFITFLHSDFCKALDKNNE